jgi:hypothetical protein
MDDTRNLIEEMDEAIRETTGGKPPQYDLQGLFEECQTFQKSLYGGGEANRDEISWLEAIKAREIEIEKRRQRLIEETEEVEELEDSTSPADEAGGPDPLARDGIIVRR